MNLVNLVLSSLVTAIGVYLTQIILSKKKIEPVKFIVFLMIYSLLLNIDYHFLTGVTKLIFNIIMTVILSYFFIFNSNLKKAIYYSIMYVILCYFVEVVGMAFLLNIFKYKKIDYQNFKFSMLLLTILNTSLVIGISCIKKFNTSVKKHGQKITDNSLYKYYIVIFTILIVLLVVNNFKNYERNLDYYINIFMLIFVVFVSMILVHYRIKKDTIELRYNESIDYLSRYEKIIDEQGKKNHEYNNQLMVLKGYIDYPDKMKEYLESIISDHKGGKNYTVQQLNNFPDGGIKGLMYHKLSSMEEKGIKPFLYINTNIKNIFETKFDVTMYSDITKLFGVFLDNAIDAASVADIKEIEIEMKKDDNYLIVNISNTFSCNEDLLNIGNKGFTTKGIGHGFGLSIVKDISRRNKKIETFSTVNKKNFMQTIIIDIK